MHIDGVHVILQVHPIPVKVSYSTVAATIASLWTARDEDPAAAWDYILHVGVGAEGGYVLETLAHECGYVARDVDGLAPGLENGGPSTQPVGDTPQARGTVVSKELSVLKKGRALHTGLDVEAIAKRLRESVTAQEGEDGKGEQLGVKVSTNAGMYLCEYIYSRSLLQAEMRGEAVQGNGDRTKRVLFLHVPPEGKRYGIKTGVEAIKQIVEGIVLDAKATRA